MTNIDLSELSLDQLKALAYDEGRKLELTRQNLVALNNMILQQEQKEIKEQVKEEKSC